tara:strand:- start:337 stop:567 length:231 start_codon:yes stop_codon:yes gene_type:complete
MNKKFELLKEAVNTYKVNHCDGNKNEKTLLEFIDQLQQLTLTDVVEPFYCWDEQALGKERKCKEECDVCASVRKEK